MKRKHKLSNAGNEQEKKTLDLAVDDNGDDDFISEDEEESNGNLQYSHFDRKETDKKMQVSKRIWTEEKNNIFVPLVHVLFSSVRKIQYLNQIISKEVILMSTLRCLFWC